jgi:peptidoglycan-N-acetylglucosamine deacetylase
MTGRLASSARQILRRGMSAALPRRLFLVSGPKESDRVVLTFDDGPHPVHTPRLLDRLKARDVRVTFFLLGRQVEKHPDIVRRIADEGHDVGHHSYTHGDPVTTSALELWREARQASELLERLVGRPPYLYRPPHGKLTPGKTAALWGAGQTIVLWNQDPKDFSCGSAEALAGWFRGRTLAGGDVVLLHDVHPYAGEAFDAIAEAVAAANLRFGRISDWVAA